MKTAKQAPVSETLAKGVALTPRKIFLVEDHPVFREGVKQLVDHEADLLVCGEAGDYQQALEGILRLKPDLAVVDISLPGKGGLDLIKKLRAKHCTLKLLVVSMHDEALYANRVLRAGGDGYIMKQEDPGEIIHAIRDVLNGHIYVSEAVLSGGAKAARQREAKAASRALDQLADSELEILELLGRGQTNQEMGRELGLGGRVVSARVTQIRRKLKLNSINALIRYAVCWVEGAAA